MREASCSGLVQIARLEQDEAGELLFGLGKGSVGHRDLAVSDAQRRGGMDRLQRLGVQEMTAAAQLVVIRERFLVQGVLFIVGQCGLGLGVAG